MKTRVRPDSRLCNVFTFSVQLSVELILLINVRMSQIAGILKFISRINTASESFKARTHYFFTILLLMSYSKFHAQLSQ